MSAATTTSTRRLAWMPRPAGPAEGWLTVGLVAVMAVVVGWALDEPGYVTGNRDLTDFLGLAGLLGALAGFVAAKARLRRWLAHPAGAAVAAVVLPIVVGELITTGGTPLDWFAATAAATVNAWTDLIVRDLTVTRQLGHHLLAFGIVAWGTGQFAAYAVFGHRRPIDAVVVAGLVLLVNMAVTFEEQLDYLIMFSTAALLLLVRSHALEEQTAWLRRRIGDPAAVRGLYLRGGTVFIAVAVLGSLTLTATASSAPLQGMWGELPQRLADFSQSIQKFLPPGGAINPIGTVSFGESSRIQGVWFTDQAILFTVQVPTEERDATFYWRATTYDRFDHDTWSWGPTQERSAEPREPVLAGLGDDPTAQGARREVTLTIEPDPDGYRGPFVLGPQSIASVDRRTTLTAIQPAGFFGGLERDGSDAYTITALVPVIADVPGGITKNRLRAAGTNYPLEVRTRYREAPALGTIGPEARRMLAEIQAQARGDTPYDLAEAMVDYLRDGRNVRYATDVRHVDCGDRSKVECFAMSRIGYCEYYATTMVILLRDQNIPARLVRGFLPGERDAATGIETVRSLQSHAWVEVYFPGYGWVDFDPTGGDVAATPEFEEGEVVPTAAPTPTPSPAGPTRPPEETDPLLGPGGLGPTGFGRQGNIGPFVAITILLVISLAAILFVIWQRGPRGTVAPDAAWRGIARLAARFGFGPRPSQTVFEYAGSLGEVLPTSRPHLETVAAAKVEVAYGRRSLDSSRLRAVRDAQRRLRLGLLRLVLRRDQRWSRRKRRAGGR